MDRLATRLSLSHVQSYISKVVRISGDCHVKAMNSTKNNVAKKDSNVDHDLIISHRKDLHVKSTTIPLYYFMFPYCGTLNFVFSLLGALFLFPSVVECKDRRTN
jgi:hypothetical protein